MFIMLCPVHLYLYIFYTDEIYAYSTVNNGFIGFLSSTDSKVLISKHQYIM